MLAALVGVIVGGCGMVPMRYEENPWVVADLDEHKVKLVRLGVPQMRWTSELEATYARQMQIEADRQCQRYGRRADTPLPSKRSRCVSGGAYGCYQNEITRIVPCYRTVKRETRETGRRRTMTMNMRAEGLTSLRVTDVHGKIHAVNPHDVESTQQVVADRVEISMGPHQADFTMPTGKEFEEFYQIVRRVKERDPPRER